jgi:hypothetical protein
MTTELRTMLLEANPVPHNEYFEGSDELAAIFSTIERRTSMVKQDERHPDVVAIGTEPPRRRRTAVLVVAAAFAAVIAVVGIVAALSGPTTDTTVPPATTPTTEAPPTSVASTSTTTFTTTAPVPTVAPADEAFIGEIVGALNAEGIGLFVGHFAPETRVAWWTLSDRTSPYSDWGTAIENDLERLVVRDMRWEIVDCQPSEFTSAILCEAEATGRLWGEIRPVDTLLSFTIEDGTLVGFEFRPNRGHWELNEAPFREWLDENHPGDWDLMTPVVNTEESLALYDQRLTEYEEFRWRSALGSDELAVLDGLVTAFNSEDVDGFASYFTLDTLFISDIGSFAGDTLTSLRDRGGFEALTNRIRWRAAMDQTLELVECVRSESGDAIRCDVVLGGPFYGRLGGVKGVLTTEIVDGAVASYSLERNERDFLLVYLPFETWLEAEVPGINLFPLNAPTEEGIAMWEQYLPDYLASLEG